MSEQPSAATCQECGYVKLPIRFAPSPCPAYHSGLHRWSPDEIRAPGDRRDDYPQPSPIAEVYDRLRDEYVKLGESP